MTEQLVQQEQKMAETIRLAAASGRDEAKTLTTNFEKETEVPDRKIEQQRVKIEEQGRQIKDQAEKLEDQEDKMSELISELQRIEKKLEDMISKYCYNKTTI